MPNSYSYNNIPTLGARRRDPGLVRHPTLRTALRGLAAVDGF
jgi:hypothetical protein